MDWCLFLLVAASVYGCITCKSHGSDVDSEIPPEIKATGEWIISILSQLNCKGENCSSYYKPEDSVTIEPQNGIPTIKPVKPTTEDSDYEPQYPDTQHTDKPIGKPDICESLEKAAIVIESKHPDIANVKFDVIKELIRLTVLLSSMLESEDCHPAVKLLDFITLAAERLKLDCTKLSHNCTYGKITIPETTEVYTSSDYEEVYGESHTGVTHDSATPLYVTSTHEPTTHVPWKPCSETTEIIAEDEYDDYSPFVGSIRGVPGKHYPNYKEVPITSFSCADQKYIPGFYADLETGCQVFHVCYEHRRESFLCPVGTIFNQQILACDYWYSSNCCLAPTYYDGNEKTNEISKSEETVAVGEFIATIAEGGDIKEYHKNTKSNETALDDIVQFLPVKVKVLEITPDLPKTRTVAVEKPTAQEDRVATDIFNNIVKSTTHVISKTRDVIGKIPEPAEIPALKPKTTKFDISAVAKTKMAVAKKAKLAKMAAVPVISKAALSAAVPIAKMVVAKAAVPIVKVAAAKAAVPVVAKAAVPIAKMVAAKAAVPIVKMAAAVPIVAAKAAVPIAKMAAAKAAVPIVAGKAAVPIAKMVAAKAAVPIVAAKAAVPIVKVAAAVPVVAKAKAAVPVVGKIVSKAAIPIAAKSVVIPAKALGAKKVKVAAAVPVAKAAGVKSVPLIAKAKLVAAVPKLVVKAPVLKSKILAASLPFAKSAILKSTIPISKAKIAVAPVGKAKLFKAATIPVAKGKLLALPLAKTKFAASVPLVKAKLFKAAAISPLTKKALALGYMKLLKSKKLALIG